ncbi:uncharacterized protein J8A68_005963 [[Candida] subhashii]|uniref:Survival protein SurE-like phosphatase/nucleotidase domain-containing protein n=1 Tax=[Candida] subhashii TaxID=561895 RepID=A0A8J5UU88_9ASCO|nr:uncharacterized protein J8A68_005963 [[Candida] subhashii]KAG7660544.1 hypothetical protein J8A68_005963 [[Candida] subhashii]
MQFFTSAIILILASTTLAKTILLTNDDGWAATNIRATYYKLLEAGHDVYLVAPVSQRSGWGGKFDLPGLPTLETDGGFNYPCSGAPSWGHEVDDDHIWYFNGTPASCVAFSASYLLPNRFNNSNKIDLVVSGPNEGQNLSPGLFTISGTLGATYNSVYRDLPAIAFSGANTNNSFYQDDLDLNDGMEPSTIYANKITEMVVQLFETQGDNERALPVGVGLNVNFPAVGYQNETCTNPKWVRTRLTGEASAGPDIEYDAISGLFVWVYSTYSSAAAFQTCQVGDCTLPSESWVVGFLDCSASVSVFSIDYDATTSLGQEAANLIAPLFEN